MVTFEEILKFNPYHDSRGRFASANSAVSFSYRPGASAAHDRAIQREKDRSDEDGEAPTGKGFKGTLYHGSPATDIDEFDINRAGTNTSTGEKLIFFTDSKQMAEDFSYERLEGSSMFTNKRGKKGRVYEVDVEMKNPLDFRNLSDKDIDNILKLDVDGILTKDMVKMYAQKNHQLLKSGLEITAESLKSLGYDGLIANAGKAGHNSIEYGVVDSRQTKIVKSARSAVLFIGLKISGADALAIKGGESPEDFHVTLVYGEFDPKLRDDDAIDVCVQSAIDEIRDTIPDEIHFDALNRFPASESSDGKDVIYAQVAAGQLEQVRKDLLKALKKEHIDVKVTFHEYKPHMTLAYIDPDEEHELHEIYETGTVGEIMIGHGSESTHENNYTIMKTFDEILKFNPYHDARGRFASANSAISFTYVPGKSKAHDNAIERHKDRMAAIAPTEAQAKTLKSIESRTRNLKKEQFRVVDRDGNVIMQKQGDRTSVSYTIGEARDNFPGNITIHNHPDGGTFSSADLSDIGHGATEIRAAAPEGTYTLRNLNHGTKWTDGQKTWLDMRNDIDAASQNFKTARQLKAKVREPYEQQVKPIMERWSKRRAEGAPQEELDKIAKEYTAAWDALQPQVEQATHKAYVAQYHSWYRSHAGEYGFEYEFTPATSKTRKSDTMDEVEEIEKSSGEIVLDRKMREDVEEIMAEVHREYPRELTEDMNKSFSIYKTDDDKRLVFGWASVSIKVDGEQLEDRQEDMIDPEDLEEAAYEYVLNFRDTGEEHIPTMRKKGKLVESCVLTAEKQKAMGIPEGILPIAWWIGFKIEDDEAWEKVKNRTYKMFSIEGKAKREPVEKAYVPGSNYSTHYMDFPSYDMWLEENLDASPDEQKAAKEYFKTHRRVEKNIVEIVHLNEDFP